MRKSIIAAAFLVILLTGCGAEPPTRSTQLEETTAYTTTGSTQPETTALPAAVPEKTAPATVAPRDWATAIGDSVMLGAIDALLQEIPNLALIDVQGSRQPRPLSTSSTSAALPVNLEMLWWSTSVIMAPSPPSSSTR